MLMPAAAAADQRMKRLCSRTNVLGRGCCCCYCCCFLTMMRLIVITNAAAVQQERCSHTYQTGGHLFLSLLLQLLCSPSVLLADGDSVARTVRRGGRRPASFLLVL